MITRSGFIKTALLAVAAVLTGRRATREVFEIGSNRLYWLRGYRIYYAKPSPLRGSVYGGPRHV